MNETLLLCIRGENSNGQLRTGTVYTMLYDASCPCGMGRAVCLIETPCYRRSLRLVCRICGRKRMFMRTPWSWRRFVQLNDPDASGEGETKGNEVMNKEHA